MYKTLLLQLHIYIYIYGGSSKHIQCVCVIIIVDKKTEEQIIKCNYKMLLLQIEVCEKFCICT